MLDGGRGDLIMVIHPIEPIYDKNSKILILGSFPSVKSREEGFFYGHKQNRFWKVVSGVFKEDEPETVEEKKALLIRNKIALWDVIQSCDIVGSSDSSITNVVPNDLSLILNIADIKAIYVNGKTALPMRFKFLRKTHIRIFPMKNLKTQVSLSNGELRAEVSAIYFRRFLRSDCAVISVAAQSRRSSGAFSADLS